MLRMSRQRRRQILLLLAVGAAGVVLLEATAPLTLRLVGGDDGSVSRQALLEQLRTPNSLAELESHLEGLQTAHDKRLHPYIGAAYLSPSGFSDPQLMPEDPDSLNLCLLGGSFAEGLYLAARDRLARPLADAVGRPVEVTALTMGGFKQPQQLFALTYAELLGLRCDLVVNVDGFNEVAVPMVENLASGVATIYPRLWNVIATGALDADSARLLARLYELQARRERVRSLFAAPPLRFSTYCLSLWNALDERVERQMATTMEAMIRTAASSAKRIAAPTPGEPTTPREVLTRAIRLWSECSKRIARSCHQQGHPYLHVLQPNQYLAGSKPLSAEEQRTAFLATSPYRPVVEVGYPMLRTEGQRLAASGIAFLDLTQLFADDGRTLWTDTCCHLNELGYAAVADAIAAEIVRRTAADPT